MMEFLGHRLIIRAVILICCSVLVSFFMIHITVEQFSGWDLVLNNTTQTNTELYQGMSDSVWLALFISLFTLVTTYFHPLIYNKKSAYFNNEIKFKRLLVSVLSVTYVIMFGHLFVLVGHDASTALTSATDKSAHDFVQYLKDESLSDLSNEQSITNYMNNQDLLKTITILSTDQEVIAHYQQTTDDFSASTSGWLFSLISTPPDKSYRISIPDKDYRNLKVTINTSILRAPLIDRLFDCVTALLISVLLGIEMLVFSLLRFAPTQALSSVSSGLKTSGYKIIRPAAYLFLFGIDISMSFIPLHMETLYEPIFGLSKELVLGLPISVEFLCVGCAILFSGVWLDRRGWHEPFFCGLMLAGLGGIYSWLAPDAWHFIASRGVVGVGYGLSVLAAHGFVVGHTDSGNKAQGLAHLAAGVYSGSICGAATGAVLAEYYGYETVFLIGAIIVLSVILFGWLCMSSFIEKTAKLKTQIKQSVNSQALWNFLLDHRVIAVIIFSSLPAAIAVVGFLNYFTPIYLSGIGVTESRIGQVLMLFGISLTLAGPKIGQLIDASESKTPLVVLGAILGGGAFLSFYFVQGVTAAAIAVLVLGISNCFVLSSQSVYLLNLDVSQALGQGAALGIFRATSRIGQMLGPILFAWMLAAADIEDAMIYFGLAYIGSALVFRLMAGKEPHATDKMTQERAS